jgi:transglutaminase-like putative cysteine protease
VPEPGPARAYLQPSTTVPSTDPRILELAAAVGAGVPAGTGQVHAILAWLKANIRQEAVDSFSALDVLATRRAECQGHALLYAALARSMGIPTRVVNGLVYSPELGGFAYHAWNESLLDGRWVAVDATFGQLGADATHLKLGYGESIGDITPLLAWLGATKIEVLAAR